MSEIGRLFLLIGVVMFIIGALLTFWPGGFPKIPGDIYIKRENFTLYFPIVTSILLSIVLTLVLNFFLRK